MSDMQQEIVDSSGTSSQDQLRAAVDEMKIALTFEVGRDEITLAKLRTLQPGYVFELSTKVDKPVRVLANGRHVATAELLDVDGRIGVRLTETNDG